MASQLNRFVWEMYLDSLEGTQATEYFTSLDDYAQRSGLLAPFLSVGDWIVLLADEEQAPEHIPMVKDDLDYVNAIRAAAAATAVGTPEEVRALLTSLVESGTVHLSDAEDDVLDLSDAFVNLPLLSLGLHLAHPDVFLPYGFTGHYHFVPRIAEAFGIALPPVPAKKERLERWLYFAAFCAAFQEFRRANELSLPELLAFMYDFSVNYVAMEQEEELPEPRNTWLLIGGVTNGDLADLDASDAETRTQWQGNLDMRRGDVCLMYVRSPVSSLHSLWRVVEDAYEDPFFHYKHAVQIGQPMPLPRLHFRALAADPLLRENRYVKANLQGASGKALTHAEYERILQMAAALGEVPPTVPHFPVSEVVKLADLSNERDVEVKLVEPLLRRLGLDERNWTRQLPVRMGRGERVYPDYAIGVTGVAPELRVRALVEVKYRAPGERAWREAFLQAKSYGLRLNATVIMTAAAEGVQVYVRQHDDFIFDSGQFHSWDQLQEGDDVRMLGRIFSSQ